MYIECSKDVSRIHHDLYNDEETTEKEAINDTIKRSFIDTL